MNNIKKTALLGKNHLVPNEIFSQTVSGKNIACGTSVGVSQKSNDDCVGITVSENGIVLALADGHWGIEASELAVEKAVAFFDSNNRLPIGNEAGARLYSLFEQINYSLFQIALEHPGASASETTLIVCFIQETPNGKYLYWASFGDSFLFLFRRGFIEQLNSLNSYWLGMLSKLSENADHKYINVKYPKGSKRYVGVATGIETGVELLGEDDVIFICSDGLIGSDNALPNDVKTNINKILDSALPVGEKVEKLILMALSRNEVDNISCIVA